MSAVCGMTAEATQGGGFALGLLTRKEKGDLAFLFASQRHAGGCHNA